MFPPDSVATHPDPGVTAQRPPQRRGLRRQRHQRASAVLEAHPSRFGDSRDGLLNPVPASRRGLHDPTPVTRRTGCPPQPRQEVTDPETESDDRRPSVGPPDRLGQPWPPRGRRRQRNTGRSRRHRATSVHNSKLRSDIGTAFPSLDSHRVTSSDSVDTHAQPGSGGPLQVGGQEDGPVRCGGCRSRCDGHPQGGLGAPAREAGAGAARDSLDRPHGTHSNRPSTAVIEPRPTPEPGTAGATPSQPKPNRCSSALLAMRSGADRRGSRRASQRILKISAMDLHRSMPNRSFGHTRCTHSETPPSGYRTH